MTVILYTLNYMSGGHLHLVYHYTERRSAQNTFRLCS